MELEKQARAHFYKLEQTLEYQRKKLEETGRPIIQKEIDALEFVLGYAKEALSARGIKV